MLFSVYDIIAKRFNVIIYIQKRYFNATYNRNRKHRKELIFVYWSNVIV